jgi:hypothetical protein
MHPLRSQWCRHRDGPLARCRGSRVEPVDLDRHDNILEFLRTKSLKGEAQLVEDPIALRDRRGSSAANAPGRAAMLTLSLKMSSPSMMMSPTLIPVRKSIR